MHQRCFEEANRPRAGRTDRGRMALADGLILAC